MYYLNLPLEIWKYIIIFIIILIGLLAYLFLQREGINPYVRAITIWMTILYELNFINMYYTIKIYLDNSKRVGQKGPIGNAGPRGYRGSSFLCNQCGTAGEDEEKYGTDINDNNEKISDEKLKIGKCVFPFAHNNEFLYDCTTEPREDNIINDADTYGWCATSVKGDLTYKTYGYCKNSDIEKTRVDKNQKRLTRQQKYYESNYGLIDIKVAMGNTSASKCESGYKKIYKDLNSMADGKYIYLCKKLGLSDTGITDLKTVTDNETCGRGYRKIPINLNEDAGGKPIYLCKKMGDENFIKDIKVIDTDKCPKNYELSSINLNEGAGGDKIYICTTKFSNKSTMINSAFVWNKDKQLYFFKDDNYWKYDDRKAMMAKGYPKKINTKWGDIPKNIDAIFTSLYDEGTYIFKGSKFYKYDHKRLKIESGYPKYIKDHWKSVPDNLDAIYIDPKTRNVYFIKGNNYYKYNFKLNKVANGYPRIFNRKWIDAPTNISAMFYYPYDEKTYIIQTNRVYEVMENNTMASNSPVTITDKFPGLS